MFHYNTATTCPEGQPSPQNWFLSERSPRHAIVVTGCKIASTTVTGAINPRAGPYAGMTTVQHLGVSIVNARECNNFAILKYDVAKLNWFAIILRRTSE